MNSTKKARRASRAKRVSFAHAVEECNFGSPDNTGVLGLTQTRQYIRYNDGGKAAVSGQRSLPKSPIKPNTLSPRVSVVGGGSGGFLERLENDPDFGTSSGFLDANVAGDSGRRGPLDTIIDDDNDSMSITLAGDDLPTVVREEQRMMTPVLSELLQEEMTANISVADFRAPRSSISPPIGAGAGIADEETLRDLLDAEETIGIGFNTLKPPPQSLTPIHSGGLTEILNEERTQTICGDTFLPPHDLMSPAPSVNNGSFTDVDDISPPRPQPHNEGATPAMDKNSGNAMMVEQMLNDPKLPTNQSFVDANDVTETITHNPQNLDDLLRQQSDITANLSFGVPNSSFNTDMSPIPHSTAAQTRIPIINAQISPSPVAPPNQTQVSNAYTDRYATNDDDKELQQSVSIAVEQNATPDIAMVTTSDLPKPALPPLESDSDVFMRSRESSQQTPALPSPGVNPFDEIHALSPYGGDDHTMTVAIPKHLMDTPSQPSEVPSNDASQFVSPMTGGGEATIHFNQRWRKDIQNSEDRTLHLNFTAGGGFTDESMVVDAARNIADTSFSSNDPFLRHLQISPLNPAPQSNYPRVAASPSEPSPLIDDSPPTLTHDNDVDMDMNDGAYTAADAAAADSLTRELEKEASDVINQFRRKSMATAAANASAPSAVQSIAYTTRDIIPPPKATLATVDAAAAAAASTQLNESHFSDGDDEELSSWRDIVSRWNLFPETWHKSGKSNKSAAMSSGHYLVESAPLSGIEEMVVNRVTTSAENDAYRKFVSIMEKAAQSKSYEVLSLEKNMDSGEPTLVWLVECAQTEDEKTALKQSVEQLKKNCQRLAECEYEEKRYLHFEREYLNEMQRHYQRLQSDHRRLESESERISTQIRIKEKRVKLLRSRAPTVSNKQRAIFERSHRIAVIQKRIADKKKAIANVCKKAERLDSEKRNLERREMDLTKTVTTRVHSHWYCEEIASQILFLKSAFGAQLCQMTRDKIGLIFLKSIFVHISYDATTRIVSDVRLFTPKHTQPKLSDAFSAQLITLAASLSTNPRFKPILTHIRTLTHLRNNLWQIAILYNGIKDLRRNISALKKHKLIVIEPLSSLHSSDESSPSLNLRICFQLSASSSSQSSSHISLFTDCVMTVKLGYPWRSIDTQITIDAFRGDEAMPALVDLCESSQRSILSKLSNVRLGKDLLIRTVNCVITEVVSMSTNDSLNAL